MGPTSARKSPNKWLVTDSARDLTGLGSWSFGRARCCRETEADCLKGSSERPHVSSFVHSNPPLPCPLVSVRRVRGPEADSPDRFGSPARPRLRTSQPQTLPRRNLTNFKYPTALKNPRAPCPAPVVPPSHISQEFRCDGGVARPAEGQ